MDLVETLVIFDTNLTKSVLIKMIQDINWHSSCLKWLRWLKILVNVKILLIKKCIKILKSSKHYHTKPMISTIFFEVDCNYNLMNPWHAIIILSWSQHVQSGELWAFTLFATTHGFYCLTNTSHGDINYYHKIYKHTYLLNMMCYNHII